MQLRLPPVPVRWGIGIILFVLVFAWFTAPNPVDTSSSSDPFIGRWLINGVDPFGVEYSGSLSITSAGEQYALEWIITGALVSGTAERVGDELHAEWRRPAGDTAIVGTAEFRIDDSGGLVGVVEVPGAPDRGREHGEPAG